MIEIVVYTVPRREILGRAKTKTAEAAVRRAREIVDDSRQGLQGERFTVAFYVDDKLLREADYATLGLAKTIADTRSLTLDEAGALLRRTR